MLVRFWNGARIKNISVKSSPVILGIAIFCSPWTLPEFIALLLFVGIPLPGTGAWTGTLAASLLELKFRDTVIAVTLGVLLAGLIMMAGSLGLFSALFAAIGK